MPDLSSLYPQPPPQGGGVNALLSDPTRAIGLLSGLQDFRIKQQQADALSQMPAAQLQGQQIQNQTAQMGQDQQAAQIAAHYFGTLPDDATADDVYRMKMAIVANHPNIRANTVNTVGDIVLRDPKSIKNGIATARLMGVPAEGLISRVTGPPTEGGQPTTVPVTTAARTGAMATGLAPGESELLTSPAGRADRLQSTAATSPQYHADLENLKQDSAVLGNLQGPTVETEKKLNQLAGRLGGFGITMTPDQLRAVESFDKIANQISLNQSQFFHGSDAGLHTVVGANPSSSMSKFGREGVIDMLQGNQDAIDVTRKAWLKARALGAPASSYDQFAETMGETIDPRVFQFNRLSRENQQKFLSQMEPEDIPAFEARYQDAVKRKWVAPLKGAKADSGK
jgi:hypothetical protein